MGGIYFQQRVSVCAHPSTEPDNSNPQQKLLGRVNEAGVGARAFDNRGCVLASS